MKGWVPETTLALQWNQLASGNWVATDRGAAADKYEVLLNFAGTETTINNIINLFEYDRESLDSSQITMSNFNSDEHVFGEDLDYTGTITANLMSIQQRNQSSWKMFNLSVRLAAVSPSFVAGSGHLPLLHYTDVGVQADAEYTIKHDVAYNKANWFNPDHNSDIGQFTGTFTFSVSEMQALRTYIRIQRGATISLPSISGITYPFGTRTAPYASGYPYNVKIIKFVDLGKISENFYKATLTFAENL